MASRKAKPKTKTKSPPNRRAPQRRGRQENPLLEIPSERHDLEDLDNEMPRPLKRRRTELPAVDYDMINQYIDKRFDMFEKRMLMHSDRPKTPQSRFIEALDASSDEDDDDELLTEQRCPVDPQAFVALRAEWSRAHYDPFLLETMENELEFLQGLTKLLGIEDPRDQVARAIAKRLLFLTVRLESGLSRDVSRQNKLYNLEISARRYCDWWKLRAQYLKPRIPSMKQHYAMRPRTRAGRYYQGGAPQKFRKEEPPPKNVQ
jgi:hypothetical protein